MTDAGDDTAESLPFVSMVIPVRNGARHLPALFNSLAANQYPADRYETVVADHSSNDGTSAIARSAGARVISVSRGPVSAVRNAGARAASGAVLGFVDADHEIGPDWLSAAAAALNSPDVGVVGDLCRAPANGTWVQQTFDRLRARATRATDVSWLGSGNMAVRREAFEAVGGFDESLEVCEDVDLCQRMRAAGWRVRAEPLMRNVHFGDPRSLGDVVRGERWRGRDNLRVSFRERPPLRAWPGILTPVLALAGLTGLSGSVVLAPWLGIKPALAAIVLLAVVVGVRTSVMIMRPPTANPIVWLRAVAVAAAFELGRALALVAGASHATRSGSEP